MNIGTIGTGFIVDTFLSAINNIDDVTCVAMYSRKKGTAAPLAEKYDISRIYTDLDEMLEDEAIDFIYVASPNSLHFEQSYRALSANKHVICEKPITSNTSELEKVMTLAKEKNLLYFEAITTIHLPNYQLIKEHLEELGELKFVQCNYSQYSSRYTKLLNGELPNVFNPAFSGGALMDINIYNVHFVMNLFGVPKSINYAANKHENGIDTSGILVLKYDNFISQCVGCKDSASTNFALIQGEKGFISVEGGANSCIKIVTHTDDKPIILNTQTESNRMHYELLAFKDIYEKMDVAACYDLLEHSHSVMKVLDKARESAGIVFEADQK